MRVRHFENETEIEKISKFLEHLYTENNGHGSSLQPFWEYSSTHPFNKREDMNKIGIIERDGDIVGTVFYDIFPNDVFIDVSQQYSSLKEDLVVFAEENFRQEKDPENFRVFAHESDTVLNDILKKRGYQRTFSLDRVMCQLKIPEHLPTPGCADGFKLISLEDEFDIVKISRVLHRGFNHEGEPSPEAIEANRKNYTGPNFRRDLTLIIAAPQGDYAAYAGLWYQADNKYGYVEPVATAPEYRRKGLARAALLEGIRRCKHLGATDIYVGGELPLYLSVGFKRAYVENCWSL